jgi:hypothetical protein
VLGTADDTAKLIVLAVAAEWDPTDPNRRFRKLSMEKTGRALEEIEASMQQRLEDNRKYWEQHLQTIDGDLKREPEQSAAPWLCRPTG